MSEVGTEVIRESSRLEECCHGAKVGTGLGFSVGSGSLEAAEKRACSCPPCSLSWGWGGVRGAELLFGEEAEAHGRESLLEVEGWWLKAQALELDCQDSKSSLIPLPAVQLCDLTGLIIIAVEQTTPKLRGIKRSCILCVGQGAVRTACL